jgi:hypothetical protein
LILEGKKTESKTAGLHTYLVVIDEDKRKNTALSITQTSGLIILKSKEKMFQGRKLVKYLPPCHNGVEMYVLIYI